jgi:hypothetical protein
MSISVWACAREIHPPAISPITIIRDMTDTKPDVFIRTPEGWMATAGPPLYPIPAPHDPLPQGSWAWGLGLGV